MDENYTQMQGTYEDKALLLSQRPTIWYESSGNVSWPSFSGQNWPEFKGLIFIVFSDIFAKIYDFLNRKMKILDQNNGKSS